MAGFVRSDTDTTPLGIMMMAHSCQIGDDNDEDGEDNGDKKRARGSIEMVEERGNFGEPPLEERSKLDCETGNMGEERGNPGGNSNGNLGGGILAKLIFGNFDSKGRY